MTASQTQHSAEPRSIFCINCGQALPPGTRFCWQCGTNLESILSQSAQAVTPEPKAATPDPNAVLQLDRAVPFAIQCEAWQVQFHSWLQESMFATPARVTEKVQVQEPEMVWAPVYICRADVVSYWSGEYSQEHQTVEPSVLGGLFNAISGNPERRREEAPLVEKKYKVWFKHQGEHRDNYRSVVRACALLTDDVWNRLWPFSLDSLAPAAAELSTGLHEPVSCEPAQAWEVARRSMERMEKEALVKKKLTERMPKKQH